MPSGRRPAEDRTRDTKRLIVEPLRRKLSIRFAGRVARRIRYYRANKVYFIRNEVYLLVFYSGILLIN